MKKDSIELNETRNKNRQVGIAVRCPRCGHEDVIPESTDQEITLDDIDEDALDIPAQGIIFDKSTNSWVCLKCGFEWRILHGKPEEVVWHIGKAHY